MTGEGEAGRRVPTASTDPFGIYVHLPYCAYKCPYCDFNAYAVATFPEEQYVQALITELSSYACHAAFQGRRVATVYFGGGTPSLFSARSIAQVLDALRTQFPGSALEEVTLEANPGSVSLEYFKELVACGVDRLSIGSQSFNPQHLKTLGRKHSGADVESAISCARAAGLKNISLDLIFAVPDQTLLQLEADISRTVSLDPQHVSVYGLTIEPGTPLFQTVERGIIKPVDDEAQAEMYGLITSKLEESGFHQYEISNFSRSGHQSRHNMSYWNGADYLGIGAGAHSFFCLYDEAKRCEGHRWSNVADPSRYMQRGDSRASAVAWNEKLTREDLAKEYFYLGLRKNAGASVLLFEQLFGHEAFRAFEVQFQSLVTAGLLTYTGDTVKLTKRGQLLSDSVFEQIL